MIFLVLNNWKCLESSVQFNRPNLNGLFYFFVFKEKHIKYKDQRPKKKQKINIFFWLKLKSKLIAG